MEIYLQPSNDRRFGLNIMLLKNISINNKNWEIQKQKKILYKMGV